MTYLPVAKLSHFLVFILCMNISTISWARMRTEPFVLKIQGFTKDIKMIKLKAEYEMAKNTSYCRGISMPGAMGDWNCSDIGAGVQSCERSYQCKMVTRDFNVGSQTAQLVAQMKGVPKISGKFKIELVGKPQNKLKREVVSKITKPRDLGDPTGLRLSTAEIEALRDNRLNTDALEMVQDELREQKARQEAQAEATAQLAPTQKSPPAAKKFVPIKESERGLEKKAPQTDEEELADLFAEEQVDNKKTTPTDWKLETGRSTDGDTLYYKLGEKKVSKEKVLPPLKLFSFTAAMLQSSDSDGNSLATFEGAWTPEYSFKNKWGMRALVGAHFFKTTNVVSANDEGENFLVFDLAVLGTYEMGRLYAEAGLGIQKWMDTLGESYSTIHLGVGYRFKNYQLMVVDRIFINYSKVSTETDNSDLRFGVGMSF